MNNNLKNAFSKSNITNIILILCNIFNIVGNYVIEEYQKYKEKSLLVYGKKIFLLSLIITLFIYIYFVNNNYNNVIKLKNQGKSTKASIVRLAGSILFIIGLLCFIYYQLNENEISTSPET